MAFRKMSWYFMLENSITIDFKETFKIAILNTIASWIRLGRLKGDYDHLPEAAFYLVGTIEEAVEKGKKLAQEAA